MGLALVVGLGHDSGGEEHVTQGAALVPVHLGFSTVLQQGGEWSGGGGVWMDGGQMEERAGRGQRERSGVRRGAGER